ncbi:MULTISPECIES: hypothetical protein [unclassified Arthrobacter]|uniref:hypothetical protein n=1 Tax=unclassified Arthrobacter TaxID=235627 RepID=UPI000EB6D154|nr:MULTISPECIES: hypothetical protein [unclassified Arthrobacter]AXV46608.1 hypothetical protein pA58H2_p62 [Arthrobacter sp.]
MMIQKRAVGGRPSKGDRHVFTTRVPMPDAEKLFAVTDAMGISASQFIAEMINEKLSTIDLDKLSGQGALPIKHVS